MAKKNKGEKETARLGDRLNRRGEDKGEVEVTRLGDRLKTRVEKEKEEGEKAFPPEKGGDRVAEFFDNFKRLSDRYPELRDIKVSDLQHVISRVGMKHPEEVADELREEGYRSELRKLKDDWITY